MAAPRTRRGLLELGLATARSLVLLLRTRPHVTLATGGYVSIPVAFASWLARVPLVLFLPDVVPGKAVSATAPLAHRIAVTSAEARRYLPSSKTVVTGYPVRPAFRAATRESGRRRFGVPVDARLLCVFGGSQGSRSINIALAGALPELLRECYVLHICGEKRLPEAEEAAGRIPHELRSRYTLLPYLHDEAMAEALAAADLAICRSGASTLGELPATGTPAILVPLPERGVHQRENAQYLASAGAAVILEDESLGAELIPTVRSLLGDATRLEHMESAARALAVPDAAGRIARLVAEVGGR